MSETFYYKEQFAANAQLRETIAATLEKAVEDYKPVLKRFDGKVINKRLKTAIDAAAPECYSGIDAYNRLEIRARNRNISYGKPDRFGCRSTLYCDECYLSFKYVVSEENRLNAAETIGSMESAVKQYREYTEKIKWEAAHYDELKLERDKIRAVVEEYEKKLTWYGTDLKVKR